MSTPNFVVDNDILWLEIPKAGTPAYWEPGKTYVLGDTVIPRPDFVLPPNKENVMFQCVGFVGKSAITPPSMPPTFGNTVIDNNIEWVCRDQNAPSIEIDWFEYYQTNHTLTLT